MACVSRSISPGSVRALPHAFSASGSAATSACASASCSVNCCSASAAACSFNCMSWIFARAGSSFCSAVRRASSAVRRSAPSASSRSRAAASACSASPRAPQLRLQRRLDRRPVDGRALARQLREQSALLLALRDEALAPPFELGETIAATALGEARFLRGALRRRARVRGRAQARPPPRCADGARLRLCASSSCSRDCRSAMSATIARAAAAQASCSATTSAVSCAICARRCCAASAACRSCMSSSSRSCDAPLLRADGQAFRVIRVLRDLQLGVDGVALHAGVGGRGARTPPSRRRVRRVRAGARARRAIRCPARRTSRSAP